MAEESKILARIDRGGNQELQIAISEYKGKSFLNLRIFYTKDDGATWLPTQKGVTCYPEDLETLAQAIEDAKKELLALE
jgi:hypothetical protein